MTAVEWLMEQITYDNGNGERYNSFIDTVNLLEYFNQALEMEKQQKKNAFIEGHNVCRCVTDNTDEAKECFEEWFEQFKK